MVEDGTIADRELHVQAGWSQLAEKGRRQDHPGDAREAESAPDACEVSQMHKHARLPPTCVRRAGSRFDDHPFNTAGWQQGGAQLLLCTRRPGGPAAGGLLARPHDETV